MFMSDDLRLETVVCPLLFCDLETSLAQVYWVFITVLGLLPDISMERKQESPLDQGAIRNQIRNRIESGVAVSGCAFA